MTQVVIDDTLIQKARSVTVLTKDEDIVRVALEEYILGGEARKEALELARCLFLTFHMGNSRRRPT